MVSATPRGSRSGARDVVLAVWLLGWALFIAPACGPGQYMYDPNGRLVAVVDPSQDSSGGGTAIYNYDGPGNLTSIQRQATTTLAILSFTPSCASAGGSSTITVNGTGFSTTAGNNVVTFPGGATAAATSATANQLIVPVPAGAAGSANLKVTVSGGTPSPPSAQTFMVGCGAPTITTFTTCPGQTCSSSRSCCIGAAGTGVTVSGANFDTTAANDRLTFHHNRLAGVGTATMMQIATTAPASVTSGKLMLSTPQGLAVSPLDFFAPPPGYTVAQIDPNQTVRVPNPSTAGMTQTINIPAPDPTTGSPRIGLTLFDLAQGDNPCWYLPNTSALNGYINLPLYDPDRNSVSINGGIGGQQTSPNVITRGNGRPVPITGTYMFVTIPNSGTTGSLTLTAYNSSTTVKNNITPTLTGTPVSLTTTGPCQETWFRFTEAQGHRFSATGTSPSPSNFSYRMDLRDSNGNSLGGAGSCLVSGATLAAAPYQLQFTGNDPSRSAGSLTVTLYDVSDEIHPVTINPSTHQGSVRLTVNAPGEKPNAPFVSLTNSVTIQMTAFTSTNSQNFATGLVSLGLYDSNGNKIADTDTSTTLGPIAVTAQNTYSAALYIIGTVDQNCGLGYTDVTITNN